MFIHPHKGEIMRPLEMLLLLSFIPTLLLPFVPPGKRPRLSPYVGLLPLIAAAAQLLIEGYRWQLVPAYGLALIIPLMRLPQLLRPQTAVRRRWVGIVGSVFSLLLVGLTAALASLMPVFAIPAPTGEYAVGTTARHLRDQERSRDLMVQFWYPADEVDGMEKAGYLPQVERLAPAMMSGIGMPSFAFDHMRYIEANSYEDARAADSTFPVLVFSHGMGGYRHQNVAQMEELASHGYIVVSIDHTGYAAAVILSDGTLLPFTAQEQLNAREQYEAQIRQMWQQDQRFVVDQLEAINSEDELLRGRLDLSRMGAFGHSFGGATITRFCEEDARCLASINMDGTMPDVQTEWQKPFTHLMSDTQFIPQPDPTDDQLTSMNVTREQFESLKQEYLLRLQNGYALRGEQGEWLHVQGMLHQNFSDVELAGGLFRLMGATGSIDPLRGNAIMNAYLLAFFDAYVKGEPPSPLIAGESPEYPEVRAIQQSDLPAPS
jgi:predicted dienelactone hydrolase